MANSHLPTKDFRWPESVQANMLAKDQEDHLLTQWRNEADQLRKDRDELARLLREEHARNAPVPPCYDPCSPLESCDVCALLSRVKGR